MAILTPEEVVKYVKKNQTLSVHITDARVYSKTLKALIKGEDYKGELIKIDHIESDNKKIARDKYTFSMKDVFKRLSNNIENIWTSSGGTKVYDIDNEEKRKEFIAHVSDIRGGQSVEEWNKNNWTPVYHYDPAGVTFLEYDSQRDIDPFPVNKGINNIRNYIPNGICVEVILFEPKTIKATGGDVKEWRLVDDVMDYIVTEAGDSFVINDEKSFPHPFGRTPALINSDLIDPDNGNRLSPFDSVIELAKEYLRDKSIKTIFKFTQGFPLFWRYVTYCKECSGTGKSGTEGSCGTCSGHGIVKRRDVTDSVDMPVPTKDDPILNPLAGFITPPIEIWDKFQSELDLLERVMELTVWGALVEGEKSTTATGRILDIQPIIQTLNSYSTPAEKRERKITEMLANFFFPDKDKSKPISSISYGRMYSILSSSSSLEMYHKSKENGDNNTILDALYLQILLSMYKSDPVSLRINTIKSDVEPYLHYDLEQIGKVFGSEEAQRKILFQEWWSSIIIGNKNALKLDEEFSVWFDEKSQEEEKGVENVQTQSLNGAQVTSMVTIVQGVGDGTIPKESAINILTVSFGLSKEDAEEIINPIKVKQEVKQLNNNNE